MSPITKSGMCAGLAFSILLLAAGCSDPKNEIFNVDTGKHTIAWLPGGHSLAITVGTTSVGAPVYSTEQCTECHSVDLSGGISSVSCTSCHLGGPTTVHPLTWDPIYLTHGPSVSTGVTGTALCANQYCHGTALTGVANSGPSCDKNAGIGGCHSIPYDPLTVTCGACHRIPPNGTTFPNLAGKHGKHATSNTISCDVCHNGASGYVGDHRNDVINFNFLAAYNPKSGGTPSFNTATKTCSNMSCHGAQITPSWYIGSLDVNTQCLSCHAQGQNEYNSYFSGEHVTHVGEGIACTECHDTGKLAAVHFNDLNTTAITEAWTTLRDSVNYTVTGFRSGTCTINCHGEDHISRGW
jgi:predicted CxxxxCH...CXXCH cytochrome family protein